MKSQSSILIRSCVRPSGKVTVISMSLPSRCMCGATAYAIDVDGDRPGGLDLDVRLARGELHLEVDGGVPVEGLPDGLAGEPRPIRERSVSGLPLGW